MAYLIQHKTTRQERRLPDPLWPKYGHANARRTLPASCVTMAIKGLSKKGGAKAKKAYDMI